MERRAIISASSPGLSFCPEGAAPQKLARQLAKPFRSEVLHNEISGGVLIALAALGGFHQARLQLKRFDPENSLYIYEVSCDSWCTRNYQPPDQLLDAHVWVQRSIHEGNHQHEIAPKEANRRTVTIRSRLPPRAPLLPLVSSATRRLLNLTRNQSGRPSIHPAFLGYDVERLVESAVNDAPRPRAWLRGKASLDRPRAAGWRRSTSAYRRGPRRPSKHRKAEQRETLCFAHSLIRE